MRAFFDGWWWGWGYFICGLYWFVNVLVNAGTIRHGAAFWLLIPGALFGVTGGLSVFSAAACWLVAASRARGLNRIVIFSLAWVGMEYLRGSVIADFPWNLTGYAFGFSDATLQLASVIGIYGLTWFSALLGGSFAVLADKTIPIKRGIAFVACVWAAFAVSLGWGAWRLHRSEDIPESQRYVAGVTLDVIQPNVDVRRQWYRMLSHDILQAQIAAMHGSAADGAAAVIFPEAGLTFFVEDKKAIPEALKDSIPEGKLLIGGGNRLAGKTMEERKMWSSLVAIDHSGDLVGIYDKVKLVPWGEFVPFRSVISTTWLGPIVGIADFSRGPGSRVLSLPGLPPFIPLICYEADFPERGSVEGHVADWMLNLSDDAWLGYTTGPYQDFAMERVRTIEQGLPLVRVANTGISASVDPYGRVLASLELGQQGVLNVKLPKPIAGGTIYGRHGEWFLYVLLSGTVLLMAWKRLRPIKSKSSPPYSS